MVRHPAPTWTSRPFVGEQEGYSARGGSNTCLSEVEGVEVAGHLHRRPAAVGNDRHRDLKALTMPPPKTRCVLRGLTVQRRPSEPSTKGTSDGPHPAYSLAGPPGRGSDRAFLPHR